MASHNDRLKDYIEVPDRIKDFKSKFPDGCLRCKEWRMETIGEQTFVVFSALAYRTPDDPRPGEGTAWEPFPGTTPYTKNSELMNAETSAWGRALAALGFIGKKIATREEVEARAGERDQPKMTARKPEATKRAATPKQRGLINAKAAEKELSPLALLNIMRACQGSEPVSDLPDDQARDRLKRGMDRMPWDLVDPILEAIKQVDDVMPEPVA